MFYEFDLQETVLGQLEGMDMGAQPLLSVFDPDTETGGEVPTVESAIDAYLNATGAKPNTRASYRTTKRRWREWSIVHRSIRPMHVTDIGREDLGEFLDWVHSSAQHAGEGNPENTFNKRRRELHAVFKWLYEDQETIEALPRFPKKKEQRDVAGQYFLTDEELDALYWATYRMHGPKGWSEPWPIGAYWRVALVLFFNYGMDTQTLFPYQHRDALPLCWDHVSWDRLPPGRVAKLECEYGWLWYRRAKTGKMFIRPMNRVVHDHLRAISPASPAKESRILGVAGGGRPCQRFQRLCKLARLQPKLDVETGCQRRWELKDLRKTCGTSHQENLPGSAVHVLGHSTGTVTDKHYANALPGILQSVLTLPQPRAFCSIYDESIRPPDALFAK